MKEKITETELLLSKINDKINFCNTKNKITYTDFLAMPEKVKIQKHLNLSHIKN